MAAKTNGNFRSCHWFSGENLLLASTFHQKGWKLNFRKEKGAKAFARPRARVAALLVGLLSSRQFELPTTAGFDLVNRNN